MMRELFAMPEVVRYKASDSCKEGKLIVEAALSVQTLGRSSWTVSSLSTFGFDGIFDPYQCNNYTTVLVRLSQLRARYMPADSNSVHLSFLQCTPLLSMELSMQ
jgi:hypothetical protein